MVSMTPKPDSIGRPGLSRSVPVPARVLVVEDFVPFRRLICSTLASLYGLQVIGDVSDGLEAVQKAQELQPDLILLDIGLPRLNGIEAARQIRDLAPKAKIIFLTQESSADVARVALGLGVRGYVVKTNVGSDLPTAVVAVLLGETFVSGIIQYSTASPSGLIHDPLQRATSPSLPTWRD